MDGTAAARGETTVAPGSKFVVSKTSTICLGGLGGLVVGGPLAVGFGAFQKTPMEKAIRLCLKTAVDFIAQQTPAQYYLN